MQATSTEVKAGPLRVRTTTTGSTRTISLVGELDLSNVAALSQELDGCRNDGIFVIVVDLEQLEFIDSSGIALLLLTHKQLNEGLGRDTCLRLVPSKALAVRRTLAISGVDRKLPFVRGVGRAA